MLEYIKYGIEELVEWCDLKAIFLSLKIKNFFLKMYRTISELLSKNSF